MIKKLKRKIKNVLRTFLEIDKLQIDFQTYICENNSRVSTCETKSQFYAQILNKHDHKIEALHTTISNVVSLGSDIDITSNRNQSWAVVCVEGKYNIVKFFNLSQRDGQEMLKLLKAFEGSRYVNDTPIGYFPKNMFVNWKD